MGVLKKAVHAIPLAAVLLSGCGTAGALPHSHAAKVAIPQVLARTRSAGSRLILAVRAMFNSTEPLWIGWRQDRHALAVLDGAWRAARMMGKITKQGPVPSMEPVLDLGFGQGTPLFLVPYYRPVGTGGGFGPAKTFVLASGGGMRYPELVRSAFLASALAGADADFAQATHPTVTVSKSGLVTVQGGGAAGPSVTLSASPQYGDNVGGMIGERGSIPIATVAVDGGEFHWQGRIRLPRDYTVYHPVMSWSMDVQVHPFRGFGGAFGGQEAFSIGLPSGVMPEVHPAPVRTAPAALSALGESSDSSLFPVWPRGAGRLRVAWETYDGRLYRGSETTTVTPQGGALRVTIRLGYGLGSRQSAYAVTWLVDRDGSLKRLPLTGSMPEGGFQSPRRVP